MDENFLIIFKAGAHRTNTQRIFKAFALRSKIKLNFKASDHRSKIKIKCVGGKCFHTCFTMFQKRLRHVKFLEHFKMGKVLEHYV